MLAHSPAAFSEVTVTLARLPTGIAGVDEILHGGLMKAGVYLLRGAPGSGKAIFANQICFHHVLAGGTVGYVTRLAESHARMLEHIEQFSFYRAEAVPSSVYYVSAFAAGRCGRISPVGAESRAPTVPICLSRQPLGAADPHCSRVLRASAALNSDRPAIQRHEKPLWGNGDDPSWTVRPAASSAALGGIAHEREICRAFRRRQSAFSYFSRPECSQKSLASVNKQVVPDIVKKRSRTLVALVVIDKLLNVTFSLVIAIGLINLVFLCITGKDVLSELCQSFSVSTQDFYLAIATCCIYTVAISLWTLLRTEREVSRTSRRWQQRWNRAR